MLLRPHCVDMGHELACMFIRNTGSLTLAVWKSIVTCCTARALPPDDVGLARALSALRIAVLAGSPSRVTVTRQSTVMVKGYQGPCRILTESRGCLGAVKTEPLMVIT